MITRGTKSVGIFSLVFFLGACVLVVAATLEVDRLGNELEEEVRIVANSEALKQQAAQGQQVVEETRVLRQELSTYLLTEDETINFLAEIEAAAAGQGVELSTQALELLEAEDGNFDTLSASFAFSGENDAVFRLIEIFENLPYESVVSRLSYKEHRDFVEGDISIALTIASYDQQE